MKKLDLPPLLRVKRISRIMRYVIALGMLLDIGGIVAIWSIPSLREKTLFPSLDLAASQVTMNTESMFAAIVISLMPIAVLFWVLWSAFSLFRHYEYGEIFATASVRCLRRIALGLLTLAALSPLTKTLLTLALTIGNPPGQTLLAIGVSSDDYLLAAFGGLLLAVSWVMVEAASLSEENSRFI